MRQSIFLFYFMNGVINDASEGNYTSNDHSHLIGTVTIDKIRDRTVPYSEWELIFIHGLISNYHSNYLIRTEDKITL